jgi:excisionase family DNA binding protein
MQRTMLAPDEVARIVGVSSQTIRRWADAGTLPAVRLPSGHRGFEAHDVLELLRQLRRKQGQRNGS